MTFGGTEIILILAVIILFFGARRIPEMARGIGQGIKEFKKTTKETDQKSEQHSVDT